MAQYDTTVKEFKTPIMRYLTNLLGDKQLMLETMGAQTVVQCLVELAARETMSANFIVAPLMSACLSDMEDIGALKAFRAVITRISEPRVLYGTKGELTQLIQFLQIQLGNCLHNSRSFVYLSQVLPIADHVFTVIKSELEGHE